MNCILVEARQHNIIRINELINQAKVFLRNNGVDQWQDGYPGLVDIENDIRENRGFLCLVNEKIVGYLCISFDGEPAYEDINGKWLSIQPYVVVHRLALDNDFKGQGLSSKVFRLVEEMSVKKSVHSFKIDTDIDNKIMKHILEKNEFHYCGEINFQNSLKLAYEKLI